MRRIILGLAIVAFSAPLARAEHARIDLSVSQRDSETGVPKKLATASMDVEPPLGGINNRPLAKARAREPMVLEFFFTNTYPHATIKAARVRYFIVRVDKIGQKNVPELTKDVITQGSFTLNFKPQGRVGARVEVSIPTPGIYLLR